MAACDTIVREYFDWAEQQLATGLEGVPRVGSEVLLPFEPDVPSQRIFVPLDYQKAKTVRVRLPSGVETDLLLPARFTGGQGLVVQGAPVDRGFPPLTPVGDINVQLSSRAGQLHVNVKLRTQARATEFGFQPDCNPPVMTGYGNPNDARTFCILRIIWKRFETPPK